MYVIYDVCINDGGSPERDGVGHKEQIVQLLWNKVGKMFGPEARLEMNRTKMTRAANANNTWEFQFNLFYLYIYINFLDDSKHLKGHSRDLVQLFLHCVKGVFENPVPCGVGHQALGADIMI